MAEWSAESRRTPIEHEEKLKTIVQRPLSVDVEDLDYVDASLQDITRVRFFRRFAKRTDWLNWIENKQVFTELFQPSINFSEINAELAEWFAENFVCDNSSEGLGLLLRKKQQMGWLLASAIARRLFVQKPRPTLEIGKWIPLLTNSLSANANGQFLEYILDQSVFPNDQFVVLVLFDYLTVQPVRSWNFGCACYPKLGRKWEINGRGSRSRMKNFSVESFQANHMLRSWVEWSLPRRYPDAQRLKKLAD